MAVYFLYMKSFGRAAGSSAVSAAAYRAGERLHDERRGQSFDHSGRRDVLHKEILLPAEFAADPPAWTQERGAFWNFAERAEERSNARVAREFLVALPHELDLQQQTQLTRAFAQELSDRYRFGVDVAIHTAREHPGSDPRNFHAHLLATTREIRLEGPGAKTTLEWSERNRAAAGLGHSVTELLHVRRRWAESANEALRSADVEVRIDHRSLAAQGIDREPIPQIPRAAYELERRGDFSYAAERLRREYLERVAAREAREVRETAYAAPAGIEETRRQAREAWLKMRRELGNRDADNTAARDDELTR